MLVMLRVSSEDEQDNKSQLITITQSHRRLSVAFPKKSVSQHRFVTFKKISHHFCKEFGQSSQISHHLFKEFSHTTNQSHTPTAKIYLKHIFIFPTRTQNSCHGICKPDVISPFEIRAVRHPHHDNCHLLKVKPAPF